MASFRSFILLFVYAISVVALSAPPATAVSLDAAERATEKFLARIADNKLDDLANYLGEDELFGKHPAGAWQQSVDGIKTVFKLVDIGESKLVFEKTGQKNLGGSLVSMRYVVLFPDQPLLFDFWLYKSNKEWQFLNVNFTFGTNSKPQLERWFDDVD